MIRCVATFTALTALPLVAHAHDGLRLDSTLHHALHAIGSERVALLVGLAVAVAIGFAARRAARVLQARRARGQR